LEGPRIDLVVGDVVAQHGIGNAAVRGAKISAG